MLFYIRVHGLDPVTLAHSVFQYACHDYLDAINACKQAVYGGYLVELLIEEAN